MAERKTSVLAREGEIALHERLLSGDPVAPNDLAVAYLAPLIGWLASRFPRGTEHDHITAAEDAILNLIKRPLSYDPAKQSLEVYLHMSAAGDYYNLLAREKRHSKRRAPLETVEDSEIAGKYLWELNPVTEQDQENDARSETTAIPTDLARDLSPQDLEVLRLMQAKERRTEVYARVLDLTHLPFPDQQRAVKRVKDRLQKRLERARGGS